jgi:hypothetical protein
VSSLAEKLKPVSSEGVRLDFDSFIEPERSELIAGCGRKTATFLQVLKDTADRTYEAVKQLEQTLSF